MRTTTKIASSIAGVLAITAVLLLFAPRAYAGPNDVGSVTTDAGVVADQPRRDIEVGFVRRTVERAIPLVDRNWVWVVVAALAAAFLVAQDRIGRHDPVLTAAPVHGRPRLTFDAPAASENR